MNQYKNGKGSDRALWSDMWNCLPIRKDRATNEERLYVPRPFVSLYGGIQPALLDELDDERSREDGFVYRFLPCFPDRRPTEIPRKIKRSAEKQWNATVEKLFALEPDEDGNPRIAKLDRAAQKEFKRFFTDNAKDVDALDEDDPRRGAWVKLSLYWSRLALVIHLLRWASADRQVDNPMSELVVDGDSALAASILVDDYFKPHLAKVSAVLLAAQAQRLKDRALRYLRAHRGEWTGTRDICHGLNTFKKETEEALSELLDDNLVEFEAKQHHGQTWPRWRVEGN